MTISGAVRREPPGPRILGRLLVEHEKVAAEDLAVALDSAREPRERVGETLVRMGATTPEAVARCLAVQLGIPLAEAPLDVDPEAVEAVRSDLLRTHRIVPLSITRRTIRVAMADPLDLGAVDDIQFQTGRRVEPLIATETAVTEAVARLSARNGDGHDAAVGANGADAGRGRPEAPDDFSTLVQALPEALREGAADPADEGIDRELEEATRRAPVVRLVDRILRGAIDDGASDIHVEETGRDVRVRLRIDGTLHQTLDLPAGARRAVLSRIKVLAGMDISVRRRAQDGRVSFRHDGRRLTLRVSTLPVNGGEKAVVRILDSESAPRSLGALGMAAGDLAQLRAMIRRGEGVILAAGPTGSGKSTTLFAALSELDRDTRNVVTVEDPVEYRLPGASQVQV
ncbi:MAG TPA: hypothetical protein ENO23_03885, partial [Alphaproteobacteria bacterium]|nr:hypothetical protein [Alphaproteobacteria bacterium]